MPIARFSPFELLLLKSRHQADTAALLLLAWVLASHGRLGEAERAKLGELAAHYRHGHDLQPLIEIASQQNLDAIQLAAEVMQKHCLGEQAHAFLRQAIGLAVSGGKLAQANHHVLRFLADLLGVSPAEFSLLFEAAAGKAFGNPDDPSRSAYWQAKEHRRQQEQAHDQQRHEEEQRKREQQRHQQYGSGRQERAGESHQRRRQREAHQTPPPNDHTRRALAVLGLPPGSTRSEIRTAYRRLAQLHHPDRFFAQGEARVASASLRFQKIRNAYDYLMRVS
ncbi:MULTISPECIES: DnaJ domain-containing protein [Halomonadaceae]|uniref:DnaJ domain-containing protein n=1 Tax=Halomonadaceae TaxID=28256 RepID=UPI00159B34F4|nr:MULTISPECIES: DnaJ domain-containing protein [Halomonas]QJQ96221.1 DnaJ domain-containing protein [Halomonas sp. PA5]